MSIQSVGSQVDIQRAKAEKFVNASDNTISRLANRNYNKLYNEENKKFDKRVSTTLKTLPFVAVASSLAMGRGKKGALMSGLSWGMALAAPSLVAGANKVFVKNPKVAEAERKHPVAALVTNVAASVGAYMGLTSLADKALANPKVIAAGKNISTKASNTLSAVGKKLAPLTEKIKMPEFAKNIKVPEFVKNGAKAVSKNSVVKGVTEFAKDMGKGLVGNAPTILAFGVIGAVLAKGIADARNYSGIKADIKDAQFNTAKNLVNAYSAENKELKAENAKLAQANAEEVEE